MEKQEIKKENNKLSSLCEDLIAAIFLEESQEGAARASTVAEKANISRSNMSNTLKLLKKQDLIIYEPYSLIHLTEKGKHIAYDIIHKRNTLKVFFMMVLKVDEEQATEVACDLEHLLSVDLTKRMGKFLLYAADNKEFFDNWQEMYKKPIVKK